MDATYHPPGNLTGNFPHSALLDLPHLTPAQRALSLDRMLAHWNGRDPVWIFAYGSLIWNPAIEYDDKRCGIIHGYHRSLCLWSHVYRGTPQQPGLVLGLDRGGCCQGVAFRIAPQRVRSELEIIWARELVTGAYDPRWLNVRPCGPCAAAGINETVPAIGFVINRTGPTYAGKLDRQTLIGTLRSARGRNGSSADYLFNTVDSLSAHGIEDHGLAVLADEVAAGWFPVPAAVAV